MKIQYGNTKYKFKKTFIYKIETRKTFLNIFMVLKNFRDLINFLLIELIR